MPNTRNRVTVVETVYHQVAGQRASSFLSGFTLYLDDPEQPWLRSPRQPATPKWAALECGWIKDCLMLVVRNESETYSIELSYQDAIDTGCKSCFLVPPTPQGAPKATTRIYPSDVQSLRIRCSGGEAKYSLFMVSR